MWKIGTEFLKKINKVKYIGFQARLSFKHLLKWHQMQCITFICCSIFIRVVVLIEYLDNIDDFCHFYWARKILEYIAQKIFQTCVHFIGWHQYSVIVAFIFYSLFKEC